LIKTSPSELPSRGRSQHRSRLRSWFGSISRLGALPQWLLVLISLVLVIIVWQLVTTWFNVSAIVFPGPELVWRALWQGIVTNPTSSQSFIYQLEYTLMEAAVGYVIGSFVGLIAGTAISQSRLAEKVLFPYLVGIQSMPKLAIAPLLLIWFGFGPYSKIVLVALIVFFPVMVNSVAGFANVPRDQMDLLRAMEANRWQIFRRVSFPSALPFILAGLDVGAVESVVAAIIGEFVGGQRGMGVYLLQMNLQLDTAGVFAIIIILSAVGILAHTLISRLGRKFVFWADTGATRRARR
jgi:NitT/TauT family transport system permease protein